MATGLLGSANDPIVVDSDSEDLPLSSYQSPFKVAKSRLDEGHLCEVAGPRLSGCSYLAVIFYCVGLYLAS